MKIHWIPAIACLLASRSAAQGFNIDVGGNVPPSLPSSSYGGAAGQPGAWNSVIGGTDPVALVDLAGSPSSVVVGRPYGFSIQSDAPGTTGGDQDLMDDQLDTDNGAWIFSGLAPGDYLVYTYAWNSGLDIGNGVLVHGSSDPAQSLQGPWPGTFVQGITHALHHVEVGLPGTIAVTIGSLGGFTDPVIGGFQIVPDVPAQGFSFCEPGALGVIACPCSNAPAGSDRGCDNSSSTGGATLSVHGTASLAGDTVVLSTSGEPTGATSIVSQGDLVVTSVVFGQGVRCVGGNLKRLYTKPALGGHVGAPWIGDPKISQRSAALGDPIQAGTQRFYYVYYRDPNVLGGCPPSSTFNSTQAGSVLWSL